MHIFVENFPDLIDKKHHIFLQALSPSVGMDGRACAGSVAVRQIASAMLTKQNKHPARLPMSERSLPPATRLGDAGEAADVAETEDCEH